MTNPKFITAADGKKIYIKYTKKKLKNPLAGAINIAIEDAERFGTSLVIKGKDGKIREVSPAQMKRLISKKRPTRSTRQTAP